MQLLYGFITRYVPRPTLLAGGQLVFGGALMLGGLAQSVGQLLGSISLARIGASPQHPVGNALLSDAFPEHRRGFAISAHISGGNVGTILVPFVGAYLILQLGWHWTLALFGIPALIVGVLIALRIREDRSAERHAARRSGSVWGQLRDVLGRRDIRLIMGAALIAAGGRGLDIVAPFMLLYFSPELGPGREHHRLAVRPAAGGRGGRAAAGRLAVRPLRPAATLVTYWLLSAVGHPALQRGRLEHGAAGAPAPPVRHGGLQRIAGAAGLPGRSGFRTDPGRCLQRLLHRRVRDRRLLGGRDRHDHRGVRLSRWRSA